MHLICLGSKRRFLLAGLVNILLTNALLHPLLYSSTLKISVVAIISQIFNSIFVYFYMEK